jgi:hypothetical protein
MQFFRILYSVVLLAWLFCLYEAHAFRLPFPWWKLGVIAEVLSIVFFAGAVFSHDTADTDDVSILATAAILNLREASDAFRNEKHVRGLITMVWVLLSVVCCAPLVIYFCSFELAKFFSWLAIIGVWIALYAVGATIWWMARREERHAKNPLQGLVEAPRFSALKGTPRLSIFGIRLLSRRTAPAMAGLGRGEVSD